MRLGAAPAELALNMPSPHQLHLGARHITTGTLESVGVGLELFSIGPEVGAHFLRRRQDRRRQLKRLLFFQRFDQTDAFGECFFNHAGIIFHLVFIEREIHPVHRLGVLIGGERVVAGIVEAL